MGMSIVHTLVKRESWERLFESCGLALARCPDDELAAEILEHLFVRQLGVVSSEELERTCIQASELLERAYRDSRQWKKLAGILLARLEACEDPEARLGLHHRLARVYEQNLSEPVLALGVLARAFAEQPQNEILRRDLERLAEQGRRWEELAGIFLDVLDGQPASDWTVALRRRVARIFEDRLAEPEEAARQWRLVLDACTNDPEALGALARLKRLQQSASEARPVETEENEEVLELLTLARLFREHGNYEGLVDVLRQMARLETNPKQKKKLYYEVAYLAEEKLGRHQEAVQAYLDLLASNIHDLSTVRRLNKLYLSMAPCIPEAASS